MKVIGYVDYFIDEWHSNNCIVWLDELCRKYGYDFKIKYAWAETDTYPGKLPTDEWCAQKGIQRCKTIEELCEKSDYIMVFAPANPEKHLEYAEKVFKYGKNTYIDKTFAPNKEEAEKIYELGEKYGTKFFSTSALRYAREFDEYEDGINSIVIKGGGGSFEEYIIHQIEMLVKLMGVGAEKVKVFPSSKQAVCVVKYKDGRSGFLEYSPSISPFNVVIEDKNGNDTSKSLGESTYFLTMLASVLNFFESGKLPFEKEQTIEVISLRDALIKAIKKPDEWIKID